MKFEPTPLDGAWVVGMEPIRDERGCFSRTFCLREFEEHGIGINMVQCNLSLNHKTGTLRGMHYQQEPAAEAKLVRCSRGAMYDVIIDLRPGSPTHLRYFGLELTQKNMKALFVPHGFAHGFLTLDEQTEVVYMMSEPYMPEYACGVRYNDPALAIEWPAPIRVVSEKDQNWPLL